MRLKKSNWPTDQVVKLTMQFRGSGARQKILPGDILRHRARRATKVDPTGTVSTQQIQEAETAHRNGVEAGKE